MSFETLKRNRGSNINKIIEAAQSTNSSETKSYVDDRIWKPTVDKAGNSDVDVLSGTATIASGSTSATFAVTATTDAIVEGLEGIKVSVFDSNSASISSSNILIDNGGS